MIYFGKLLTFYSDIHLKKHCQTYQLIEFSWKACKLDRPGLIFCFIGEFGKPPVRWPQCSPIIIHGFVQCSALECGLGLVTFFWTTEQGKGDSMSICDKVRNDYNFHLMSRFSLLFSTCLLEWSKVSWLGRPMWQGTKSHQQPCELASGSFSN